MVVGHLAAAAQGALLLAQAGTAAQATALGTGLVANPTLTGTALDAPVPMDLMLGGTTGFPSHTLDSFDAIADAGMTVGEDGYVALAQDHGVASVHAPGLNFAGQFGVPSYADQGFQPGVDAVLHAPIMGYKPNFGQPSPNVFRTLESPAQTREFLRTTVNDSLGLVSDDLKIPRPTGQFANALDAGTLALGGALFLTMITRAYRELATQPGKSPLTSALKLATYIFGATVLGGRVATDVLSATYRHEGFALDLQHVLVDATYAELGVWALVAFVWAWVAAAKYPASRSWVNRFMPNETRHGPQILSGGEYHLPTEWAAKGGTQAQMTFSVHADYLARPPLVVRAYQGMKDSPLGRAVGRGLDKLRFATGWTTNAAMRLALNVVPIPLINLVARPLGVGVVPVRPYSHKPVYAGANYRSVESAFSGLQGAGGKISFSASPSNIGEIRSVLEGLKQKGITASATRTIVTNVHSAMPRILAANGQTYKILEGAWILGKDVHGQEDGTKVKIPEAMTVTEATGPVTVIEGSVEEKGPVDIFDLRDLRRHTGANFAFEVESKDLSRDLPRISDALTRRPVSRPFWKGRWQYLNPYAWGGFATNLIPFIPLPGVSKGLRQVIRRSFAPTPLTITVNRPEGLEGFDATGFNGSVVVLAAQRRTTTRLKHPPVTHLASPMVERLVSDKVLRETTTLEMTKTFFQSGEGRTLFGELREETGGALQREVDEQRGIVSLTLPTEVVQKLLAEGGLLAHYATRPSWSLQRVNVVLPNPLKDAGVVWQISAPEAFALRMRIQRGDRRSLKDVVESHRVVRKHTPGFFGGGWQGMMASGGYFLYDMTVGTATGLWNLARTVALGSVRSFRLDRQLAIAAVTIGGGIISMPVTSSMKVGMGWRDPVVITTTGSRVFLTGGLNSISGPGLLAYAGPAKYDAFYAFLASMTALRLWELPNESKEQDRMLYKQILITLLDEDRPGERARLAERLVQIEETAQDRNREGILMLRLKHLLDTGVVKSGDLEILRKRYDEIKGDPERAAHFLLALAMNESLLNVMQQPNQHPDVVDPQAAPQVWAFWQGEFDQHAGDVAALHGRYFGGADQTAAEDNGGEEIFARR